MNKTLAAVSRSVDLMATVKENERIDQLDGSSRRLRVIGLVLIVYFVVAVGYQSVLLNHVIGLPMIEHGTRIQKAELLERYSSIY